MYGYTNDNLKKKKNKKEKNIDIIKNVDDWWGSLVFNKRGKYFSSSFSG